MVSPISTAGQTDIRSYIQQTWVYVSLRDETEREVSRIHVPSDERASWSKSSTENPLEVTITVHGTDDDIIAPDATDATTIASTASYSTDSGGDVLCVDSDTAATIEADNDTAIITHRIYYPTNE